MYLNLKISFQQSDNNKILVVCGVKVYEFARRKINTKDNFLEHLVTILTYNKECSIEIYRITCF